ncbi:MAG: PKD domain-containing protein [Chloroflexota bacterium]|nr:PKD domain-containing protein [Chloroflexota bacterium]
MADPGGPYTADEGLPVAFDGSASYDSDGTIVSYEWDMDNDGAYDDATGVMPSFTWNDDYSGTIGLMVTDDAGEATAAVTTVMVDNVAPTVDAGANVDYVLSGSPVSFSSGFNDPGTGDTHTIEWDFGDGSTEVTGDESSIHAYGDNGIYTVTLTATDDEGATDAVTTTVTVNNIAPTVDAGSHLDNALVNTPISFSGSFIDPGWLDTHSIEWDFGDGSPIVTGTLSPTHAYTSSGDYTVTLTVTDDDGGLGIDTASVTVWTYIFIDEERGSELRINTTGRTYRFLAPDYDTGIKEADCMLVIDCLFSDSQWINITDCDSNVFLTVTAYGGEKDYCIATLWDKMTWKAYWLYDKWGME